MNNEKDRESASFSDNNADLQNNRQDKSKKKSKKTLITTIIVSVLCAAVGSMGGWLLYSYLNPYQDDIIIENTNNLYDKEDIEKNLQDGTIIDNYKDKTYALVNYCYDEYSKNAYTLTLGEGKVKAAMNVTQTIKSGTYNSPSGFYVQKVSNSSIVHTADKYYDDPVNKTITGYECSYPDDWTDENKLAKGEKEYTYDSYIQSFGKLSCGIYYCVDRLTDDDNPIPDSFLTLSSEDYLNSSEETKHERNGALAYSVTSNSVASSSFEKIDGGYALTVDLNVAYGVSFMSVQMKTTGRLKARPVFTACSLSFVLDEELKLVSSIFHDEYRVNTGGLPTNATSDLTQYYFTSADGVFISSNTNLVVKIPQPNEVEFNAYELYPTADENGENV